MGRAKYWAKFGAYIRGLRISKGIKTDEVADRLGVNRATVTNWELGYSLPTARSFALLSDIYDTDIRVLAYKVKTLDE